MLYKNLALLLSSLLCCRQDSLALGGGRREHRGNGGSAPVGRERGRSGRQGRDTAVPGGARRQLPGGAGPTRLRCEP